MGMAGDMFISSLLDLANNMDVKLEIKNLKDYLSKYGTFDFKKITRDDTNGFIANTKFDGVISYNQARDMLSKGCEHLNLNKFYTDMAVQTLEILINAEIRVHAMLNLQVKDDKIEDHTKKHKIDDNKFKKLKKIKFDRLNIIGKVHNSGNVPIQPIKQKDNVYIDIFPEYAEGTEDLTEFEYIWVISYLHKSKGYKLTVIPPWDKKAIPRGVFSSRSPNRPSAIGLSRVKINKIERNEEYVRIFIDGIDLINETPILDIKPVIGRLDHVNTCDGWIVDKNHIELHKKGIPHLHKDVGHLHEAADIIFDILAPFYFLQQLQIKQFRVLYPVYVGDGSISFSHGTFNIPAPATSRILEDHNIPWDYGPENYELLTPTGAALLATLIKYGSIISQNYYKRNFSENYSGYGFGHINLNNNFLSISLCVDKISEK